MVCLGDQYSNIYVSYAERAGDLARLYAMLRDDDRAGFDALREGSAFDPLADAARGRARADWLVGMNLSRAYTISRGETLSVIITSATAPSRKLCLVSSFASSRHAGSSCGDENS